jgi:hypothetical protein
MTARSRPTREPTGEKMMFTVHNFIKGTAFILVIESMAAAIAAMESGLGAKGV